MAAAGREARAAGFLGGPGELGSPPQAPLLGGAPEPSAPPQTRPSSEPPPLLFLVQGGLGTTSFGLSPSPHPAPQGEPSWASGFPSSSPGSHFSLLTHSIPTLGWRYGPGQTWRETEEECSQLSLPLAAMPGSWLRGEEVRPGIRGRDLLPTLWFPPWQSPCFQGDTTALRRPRGNGGPGRDGLAWGHTATWPESSRQSHTNAGTGPPPSAPQGQEPAPSPGLGAQPVGQGLTPPTRHPAGCGGRGLCPLLTSSAGLCRELVPKLGLHAGAGVHPCRVFVECMAPFQGVGLESCLRKGGE